ncbi:hypothetical protein [Moritella viscosa]|uniref:hypothetical protein n=1 Tax=Moritella viscosa TaxID=80854 RepID=UPI00092347EA|nr:hypothetical protein [Moritella viscosa]SHO15964.1 Putative uncharacterized protein [Moritella viscosa]SHO19176.1 Putative uncharacterized protein [Moritella viscosa]
MFIPHNINTAIFSYETNIYQFEVDAEGDLGFLCLNTSEIADRELSLLLLKRLVELSEKAMQ